jgi:hypothetical protein
MWWKNGAELDSGKILEAVGLSNGTTEECALPLVDIARTDLCRFRDFLGSPESAETSSTAEFRHGMVKLL